MRRAVFLIATFLATPAIAQSSTPSSTTNGMSDMKNMPGMQKTPVGKHHKKKHAPQRRNNATEMDTTAMHGERSARPVQNPQANGGEAQDHQNMPGMDMGDAHETASHGSAAQHEGMPGMKMQANMPGTQMSMNGLFGDYPMTRDASGTSWQPDLAEHQGIHAMAGEWMLMGHLTLYGIYDTQSGPRGADMVFPAGMVMGMARRDLAPSDLVSFRAMLSPDPFMGRRGYPLLLQTGETADGTTPLVDRQHPHDLFMELSGTYAHKFSRDDSAFLYVGYPGEPALGPPAFMHRASGVDSPAAPLTHHWLDSTHIAFGVATAGFVHNSWKIEVSQFTGREPDQHRFDFDKPEFDSTSVRASWNPDEHWALQGSWGHLHSPEQLEPLINEDRYTASAMYVTKLTGDSSIAATLGWGLKHLSDGTNLNGVLFEGEYKALDLWTLFARAEWEQSNEVVSGVTSDIGELSLGAIRDFNMGQHWKFGLGGQFAFDFTPGQSVPAYWPTPHGGMVFFRIAAQ